MTKEDEFKFIESLSPLNKTVHGKAISLVVIGNKTFSGIIFDMLQTQEQYNEVLTLLVRTYDFGKIKSISFDTVLNGAESLKIESDKQPKPYPLIFVRRPLVVPSVQDIIGWNGRSQEIYPENGAYGITGVKDRGILSYTVETARDSMIFGHDRYPTVASKAAFIWFRIAKYQAFQNGNKRTAMVAMLIMLHSNGYDFMYRKGLKQELVDMSLKIANGELTVTQITGYILDNCGINTNNSSWTTMQKLKDEEMKDGKWEK